MTSKNSQSEQNPVTALATHTTLSLEVPGELGTWDEFQAFGCQLVALRRHALIALGDLAHAGKAHFTGEETTRTAWAKTCADAWGCGRVTVLRAMALSESPVTFPPDMFPSSAYLLTRITDDVQALEILIDRATLRGWTKSDIEEMIHLHSLELIGPPATWHKLELEIDDNERIIVHINGESATIAQIVASNSDLVAAGVELIRIRSKAK